MIPYRYAVKFQQKEILKTSSLEKLIWILGRKGLDVTIHLDPLKIRKGNMFNVHVSGIRWDERWYYFNKNTDEPKEALVKCIMELENERT